MIEGTRWSSEIVKNEFSLAESRREGGTTMEVVRRTVQGARVLASSIAAGFRGIVTIMAFTESGWMRQFRLSKRVIVLSCLFLVLLIFGSTITLLRLVKGQYYLTRMRYLEQENRAMTSLLEGQAEQLSKLKLEMTRLKEFEESLRRVSGLVERPNP
jgi:hypothetical protein